MEIALILAVIAGIFIVRTFKIVPQQHAWVVERLGKYDRTLTPGLKFVVPFIERVGRRGAATGAAAGVSGLARRSGLTTGAGRPAGRSRARANASTDS